jgi:hypothetical protein
MELNDRMRHIIRHVEGADDRWGKPGAPQNVGSDIKASRIISDDCRWHARLRREDQKGPDGEWWDFIEVHAYEDLRMMTLFRGHQVQVRCYYPGPWETLFNLINMPHLEPHPLNKGTQYEM